MAATKEIAPGVHMPVLGFGAGGLMYSAKDQEAAKQTFMAAMDAGFRHIDDAEMYNNEKPVGDAINSWLAKTSKPRSEIFVTSKVLPKSVDDPGPYEACKRSLAGTAQPYFDMYLMHAPFSMSGKPYKRSLLECWREMERLVDEKLVRCIGVSNWRIEDLEQIYDQAKHKPVCNQVEAHPYIQQTGLKKWCEDHKILMTSYAPQGPIVKKELQGGPIDAPVEAAAKRLGKSPGQILLRWNLQDGRGVMTTTRKKDSGRIEEALDIMNFELSADEMAAITQAGQSKPQRTGWGTTPLKDLNPNTGLKDAKM